MMEETQNTEMSETAPNINNDNNNSSSKNKKRHFRRKLIKLVRKRPILYDPAHTRFTDIKAKEKAWDDIAKLMDHDAKSCQWIWMDLRHEYQSYARNLSHFFKERHERKQRRPVMLFADDMIFLWCLIRKERPPSLSSDTCETADNVTQAPITVSIDLVSPSKDDRQQQQLQLQRPNEPPPMIISQVYTAASLAPQYTGNGSIGRISLNPVYMPSGRQEPPHPIEVEVLVNNAKADQEPVSPKQPADDAAAPDDDDDIMIVEERPVVIDLSDDDDRDPMAMKFQNTVVITKEMVRLVELIKLNRELYDTGHTHYADYKRRSSIWNTIANELKEKATKLMKLWWLLQTRFEWETTRNLKYTEQTGKLVDTMTSLEKFLDFLKPYISKNKNTVCKQSFYLKDAWHEPIDNFKNIHSLVGALRKNPQVVNVTDKLLTTKTKSPIFFTLWQQVAKSRGITAGQCECTWLLLRAFYWELMQMRVQGYQLQDKWYFESIIGDLYNDANELKANAKSMVAASAAVEAQLVAQARLAAPVPAVTTAAQPIAKPYITSHVTAPQTTSKSVQIQNGYRVAYMSKANTFQPNAPSRAVVTHKGANNSNGDLGLTLPALPADLIITHERVDPPAISTITTTTKVCDTTVSSIVPVAISTATTVQYLVTTTTTTPTTMTTTTPSTTLLPPNLVITPIPTANAVQSKSATSLPLGIRCTPVTINHLPPLMPLPSALPTIETTTGGSSMVSVALVEQHQSVLASKINHSLSHLNPNEIMIELVSSPTGNQLVVHGPPLEWKFSLSMPTCAAFIREVMAIPLLHNKYNNTPGVINSYWKYLANKFKMPQNVCKACWNFLAENFNHFPQIAPMDELMRPFKITLKVWRESSLLKTFDLDAVSSGWLQYQPFLPPVMEEISKYNAFYRNLAKHKQSRMPNAVPEDELAFAQKTIMEKFPNIPGVLNIWTAFKNIYWRYMWELESGIDNRWPLRWWRTFAKMKFLMEHRYSTMEPFYYIVRNKILEEIERCTALETAGDDSQTPVPISKIESPNGATDSNKSPKQSLDMVGKTITVPSNRLKRGSQSATDSKGVCKRIKYTPSPPTTYVEHCAEKDQTGEDTMCALELDAYYLMIVMQKYPDSYLPCAEEDKAKAWQSVASDMLTTEEICRSTFQRALINYRLYLSRDPANRCRLNQKYYKPMHEILRQLKMPRRLNVRSPGELNLMAMNGGVGMASGTSGGGPLASDDNIELVFPERFIVDINMATCKPSLVMKNWAFAVSTLTSSNQRFMEVPLRAIFGKYKDKVCGNGTGESVANSA